MSNGLSGPSVEHAGNGREGGGEVQSYSPAINEVDGEKRTGALNVSRGL